MPLVHTTTTATEQKYDSDILKRVTALASQMQEDDRKALTVEQIEVIAQEVGIEPVYVRRALDQIRAEAQMQVQVAHRAPHRQHRRHGLLWVVMLAGAAFPMSMLLYMARSAPAPMAPAMVVPAVQTVPEALPAQAPLPLEPGQPGVRGGDFEKPVAGTGWVTYSRGETIGPWTVDSGTVDLKGTRWKAYAGQQLLDLNGGNRGAISQQVRTEPGKRYLLCFATTANPDGGPSTRGFRVLWNNTSLGTVTVEAGRADPWSRLEYEVVGTGTDHLKFESTTDGPYGPFLDGVTLEPAE
jgi:hypothetical protein